MALAEDTVGVKKREPWRPESETGWRRVQMTSWVSSILILRKIHE